MKRSTLLFLFFALFFQNFLFGEKEKEKPKQVPKAQKKQKKKELPKKVKKELPKKVKQKEKSKVQKKKIKKPAKSLSPKPQPTKKQRPVQKAVSGKKIPSKGEISAQKVSPFREIVVTASRVSESTFDTPMGVTLVDREELLEKSPRTAAEALRYKPGIWVQKTGHLGGAPIIRGFMGNRVIYLFDGIRRNTASLFKGPNSFLQNIDALDIDRIEVVRGPGSVLYGSDAIGGVINVITNERPRFTKKGEKLGGRLFARYASVDSEKSGRVEGYGATPWGFAFIGGTIRDIGNVEGGRGRGSQIPSDWKEQNWDAQADYLISKKHHVQGFIQYFDRLHGRRYDKPNREQGSSRELYGLRYFGKKIGPFESVQSTFYFHNQRSWRKRDNTILDESRRKDKTYGFDLQGIFRPFRQGKIIAGFHFHVDDLESRKPLKRTKDPDVTWTNPALFVLFHWTPLERLKIELGLRWDMFVLESDAPPLSQLDSSVQQAIANGELSLSDLELDDTTHAITGGVGLVYSLNDWLNFIFHFGRAFRAPNQSDMLRFGQFTFGFNVPTKGLDPESSYTFEGGLRAEGDFFSGSVIFFYTILKDAIVSTPGIFAGKSYIDVNGNGQRDPGEDVFVKRNSPYDIDAYGIELEGKMFLPQKWFQFLLGKTALLLYGNFSWIRGDGKNYNPRTGQWIDEPLDRAYPTNALIGLKWMNARDPKKRKWWVAFEVWMVRRFTRIPQTRLSRDPAFLRDPQDKNSGLLRADGRVPGFTIYNLFAGIHINQYATFVCGIRNITNKLYRVKDSRIDGPGINAFFALEVRY